MILKSFETIKIDTSKQKKFLFYGNNNALINETIQKFFIEKLNINIYRYDESEVLNNKDNFFNQILNSSFFENEKIILISRATDKFHEVFEEILEKKIIDVIFIVISNQLEKKSKLRQLFEKNNKTICIAFYPDTEINLTRIATEFLKKLKITISQQNLNFIINKSNNDRENLLNELKKIELLTISKKNLTIDEIIKIVSLGENHSIHDMINYCLIRNKRKTITILNENNFNVEDSILIIRTFLSKLKRILKLAENYQINKNLEQTITNAKPPIFWKEKDIIKNQLINWSPKKIRNLILELNQIELQAKNKVLMQ